MKIAFCLLLILYVAIFGHVYRTVIPKDNNIHIGQVIKASDVRRGWFGSTEPLDLATHSSQVIGHVAIKPIYAGQNIHLSDLKP